MTTRIREDPADLLARVGRHWGWVLSFGIITALAGLAVLVWPGRTLVVVAGLVVLADPGISLLVLAVVLAIWLLVFGIMQVTMAFRIRSLAR